jgi:hypothetical protein
MTVQLRISRAQHDATRLGRGFPVQANHQTHAPLQCLVPPDGGIQVQMRLILSGAESLETAQVLEVALPSICAPCPTALRGRTGREQPAVGVAPPFGQRMQIETDDFIQLCLLRIVAIHAMLGDTRRQALSMRTPLLRGEVDPGFFRLGRRGLFSRRRL